MHLLSRDLSVSPDEPGHALAYKTRIPFGKCVLEEFFALPPLELQRLPVGGRACERLRRQHLAPGPQLWSLCGGPPSAARCADLTFVRRWGAKRLFDGVNGLSHSSPRTAAGPIADSQPGSRHPRPLTCSPPPRRLRPSGIFRP